MVGRIGLGAGGRRNWPPTQDYSGETWNISAKDLGGDDAGTVKIEIKPVAEHDNSRLVKVEADFPDDPVDRVRYSKELTLELQIIDARMPSP